MTDKEKLEKIRSEVIWYIHLRNEGLIIGSCGDFEKLLKFIDSIQEEPKKCMYSKDNYTDEDRKVLCDGCKEDCKFNKKEESVSEDICNQCEAHNDKDKCDELVFGHKCPIVTTSEDLEEASEEYTSKVLERTNVLIGNQPVGEEIEAAYNMVVWLLENNYIKND